MVIIINTVVPLLSIGTNRPEQIVQESDQGLPVLCLPHTRLFIDTTDSKMDLFQF